MTPFDGVREALAGRRAVLLFGAANLLGLIPDVALAHSSFTVSRAELIPLAVSTVCGLAALLLAFGRLESAVIRAGLSLAAAASIVTGVAGLSLHLGSGALAHPSLHRLVYSAPILAPLAYSGLGLLLLAGTFYEARELRGRAVLGLAAFGLFGNFVLCLLDHAQNGFWAPVEWVAVAAGALGGASLLAAALVDKLRPAERRFAWGALAAMVVVSLVGAALHLAADLHGPARLLNRLRYGAPIFAPLLFADLAGLGALGLLARGPNGGDAT